MKLNHAIQMAFCFLILSTSSLAGQEGGGGDVFDRTAEGQGIELWDLVEYGDSFIPRELPEWTLIKSRLDTMKQMGLESTAQFIDNAMNSATFFSFVEPDLVSRTATGISNLKILTYKRVQAAIADPLSMTVQINRSVWNSLHETARAYLLVHEALWIMEQSFVLYDKAYGMNLIREASKIDSGDRSTNVGYCFYTDGWINGWFNEDNLRRINMLDLSTTTAKIRLLAGILLSESLHLRTLENIATLIEINATRANDRSYCREEFDGQRRRWLPTYHSPLVVYSQKDLFEVKVKGLPRPQIGLQPPAKAQTGLFYSARKARIDASSEAFKRCQQYLSEFHVDVRKAFKCTEPDTRDDRWYFYSNCHKENEVMICQAEVQAL